jgi:hypothetical protein
VRGRASEEGGLQGGTAEGGSNVTGTRARWLSGNKHISDTKSEMGWNAITAQTWDDEPEAISLYLNSLTDYCRSGKRMAGTHRRRNPPCGRAGLHVKLDLIEIRSMSVIIATCKIVGGD